ncbi:MAG: phosphatase PAP2 family protein [Anaeroplasmataceae bacterium]
MKKIKAFFIKYNILFLILPILFYACQGILYTLLPLINSNGHYIGLSIDNKIPVIDVFVIFYYIYYFFPILLIWLVSFKDKKKSYRMIISSFVVGTLCYIFFCFYQVQMIRPEITSNSIFSKMILFIYKSDPYALNCCPSIHTIMGVYTAITLINVKGISWISKLIAIFMGLGIILSTLFIKQHYVIDVIAGLLVSLIIYFIVYIIQKKYYKDKEDSIELVN